MNDVSEAGDGKIIPTRSGVSNLYTPFSPCLPTYGNTKYTSGKGGRFLTRNRLRNLNSRQRRSGRAGTLAQSHRTTQSVKEDHTSLHTISDVKKRRSGRAKIFAARLAFGVWGHDDRSVPRGGRPAAPIGAGPFASRAGKCLPTLTDSAPRRARGLHCWNLPPVVMKWAEQKPEHQKSPERLWKRQPKS